MRVILILLLPLLLASCSSPEPAAPAPAETSGDEGAEAPPARAQMWHHFWDIIQARDAVIGARIEAVGPPLQRVASGEFGMDMPPDWMNWIEAMQSEAARGSQAKTLNEAAVAVASLAATCADCHRTTGAGPNLEGDTRGYHAKSEGLSEVMARHVWAAEELWLGLISPRHEAWVRGAQAMAEMQLDPAPAPDADAPATAPEASAAEDATPAPPSEAAAVAEPGPLDPELEAIRALGKRALDAGVPAQQTAIYAEMLGRCASCHAEAGFD